MSSDLQKIYAEWIEHICNKYALNRTQIAKRIGVSPSTITRQTKTGWTKSPQLRIVRLVAKEFGIAPPLALLSSHSDHDDKEFLPINAVDMIEQIRDMRNRTTESQFSVAAINKRIDRLELRLEEILESLRSKSKP